MFFGWLVDEDEIAVSPIGAHEARPSCPRCRSPSSAPSSSGQPWADPGRTRHAEHLVREIPAARTLPTTERRASSDSPVEALATRAEISPITDEQQP